MFIVFLSTWSIFCPHNVFYFHMMCFLSTQHNNCLSLFETVFDSFKLIYRDWCSWFYDIPNFFPHNVFSFHISYLLSTRKYFLFTNNMFLSIIIWNQIETNIQRWQTYFQFMSSYFLSTWSIFCLHNVFSIHIMYFLPI